MFWTTVSLAGRGHTVGRETVVDILLLHLEGSNRSLLDLSVSLVSSDQPGKGILMALGDVI